MKYGFSMIRRWDIIIVCLLVLFSFLPFGIFSYVQAEQTSGDRSEVAVIKVNNKKVKQVVLSGNAENQIFDIHTKDGGVNTIQVRNNRIRIKSANCPDQVCVRTGYISKPGETIVCIPHKVVIEIQSEKSAPEPVIISS
ncbi:NusG domain II-containing protein [Sporolactobacillus sp. Y61]|uniref:NusG domain II-containing protein n=1 Tax=Sporolactobacillus sp. Y61 TaxID=3160863 RepID=A0AAU8IFK7_9BACL|nr:NusG domain II-containing protein [Sporolactobacillus sp. THM19-2]RYL92430.1 hypothetical protein EWH91_07815 [Sporolactobacillus sp. THM19-2]